MTFRPGTVQIRPPASSANLGPGFDALGLALTWYDEITARVTGDGVTVRVSGQGAGEVPTDETHLVVRAAAATFDRLGVRPPGLALTCVNTIPHARGLGSSSAAIVGGVLLARALAVAGDELSDDDVLALATDLEGHPDNVAACLLGGATVAWMTDGRGHAARFAPADLALTVLVPEHRALTSIARSLLPASVPHGDAAFTVGRAALLVHALAAEPALLLAATEDRLHQDYRQPAMPASHALVGALRADGVPAVVSGAGPTVLAFGPVDAVDGFVAHPVQVDPGGALAQVRWLTAE